MALLDFPAHGRTEGGNAVELITLSQFLRDKTGVYELCIIREDGWITAAAWIDNEDLFIGSLSSRLLEKSVKGDAWGMLTITGCKGSHHEIPCHYIDV